jgi:NIMA (never in mitosis gene a)-related kinase
MCGLNPPFRANDMNGLYKKITQGIYPPIPSTYSPDLSSMVKALL